MASPIRQPRIAIPGRLTRAFYRRPPITVARGLLGTTLVRMIDGHRLAGIIVETEAYLGRRDAAAHSFGGRHTPRNHSMYLDGGHAYVYFTYGMHHCVNVVTQAEGVPTAVLIRAIEPTEGIDRMMALRRSTTRSTSPHADRLCAGPARLCQAMAIDRSLDRHDLVTGDRLFLQIASRPPTLAPPDPTARAAFRVTRSRRIGIDYAGDWAHRLLRFHITHSPFVSR